MHSCIYEGTVRHRRFHPRAHAFQYNQYLMYLDLAELPMLLEERFLSNKNFAPISFQRGDYFGDPQTSLEEMVRETVETYTGNRPQGPIRLLTNLRYWGVIFNPVKFYYCFDPEGASIETIVLEVTNTPWNESHLYVLEQRYNTAKGKRNLRFRYSKDFHVSPFMEMDMEYENFFTTPSHKLVVHMENYQKNSKLFDATMVLKKQVLSKPALRRVLFNYPIMTAKVLLAIYWQALNLWIKRIPFYDNPKYKEIPTP